ncbi:hypothetical protein AAH979_32470 [Plantactinospora sp. ZYX-F-223]|uniref:hypothetical protein n=1 Tax=Plantactinospora sp. ZYX-F-223 TaxID=3144103 RepID=UPI0031FD23D4
MVIIATLSRYADGAWGQPDILRSRWFWAFVIGAVALLGAGIPVLRRQARG